MKDFQQEFKEEKWIGKVDSDNDGVASVSVELNMNEAVQEAVSRGIKKEDVKIVDFVFTGLEMKLVIDTDQDGEKLIEININSLEAFDEIQKRFQK